MRADGAALGTVLIGLVLAGAELAPRAPAPVAARILRLEGEVSRPGWYEADDLAAAAEEAGGTAPRLAGDTLRDGDVVRLAAGWAIPDRDSGHVEALALGRKLRLNEASEAELESLPGVGPSLARRIVAARPYRAFGDLDRVRGIGPAKLRTLAPLVEP